MLSDHQLKITDDYNIFIISDNVNKLVSNFFDKENMCFITNTCKFKKVYFRNDSQK